MFTLILWYYMHIINVLIPKICEFVQKITKYSKLYNKHFCICNILTMNQICIESDALSKQIYKCIKFWALVKLITYLHTYTFILCLNQLNIKYVGISFLNAAKWQHWFQKLVWLNLAFNIMLNDAYKIKQILKEHHLFTTLRYDQSNIKL